MDRWDDLRLFLAVARTGTLTAAAEELGVNASTVHRRVAALEADAEVTLFERGPRGYALTGAGEALLPRAIEAEEAVFAARRAMVGHDRAVRGTVRITLPPSLISWLARHLVAFRGSCPDVQPVLAEDHSMLDLGHAADVALRTGDDPPPAAVGRRLGQVAWCRYRGPGADAEPPWVVYSGLDHVAAVRWRERTHRAVPVCMAVSSVAGMHRLLVHTPAQGLLPCYLGDPEPALRRVGEPVPEAATTLWLLIHADLRRAARVRALVDFLVPRLAAEVGLLAGEA